ncbi:hypothetical protein PACTADRAFT_51131 [Pachysolen tannophilus NRRL Y-2460]|uniref:Glycosyltransferase family 34 protein n=1 Tax=Pachysolen tannophilus NRRL Y-2460 TaxID=669874 RepID=A0A1E4TRA9_PACTA|nr:hypothetical protein PACTADRAFT_51131 [Pachysolen tannophilus NRRL Y-2460]
MLGFGGGRALRSWRLPFISTTKKKFKSDDDDDIAVNSFQEYTSINGGNYITRTLKEFVRDVIDNYKKITALLLLLMLVLNFTSLPLPFDIPKFTITDPNVVIILAANEGGGVLKWKGAQEWSVERSSIINKRHYAEKHGYGLTIKDMTLKRRYSHEWREGWEKVDIIKQTMRQYPNAEWFWWLDLHTYIMEPQISLEDHVFNHLDNVTYRSLEEFNPLNLKIDIPYVDYTQPIDLIVTQDCGGFNLGSFFIRRSAWTECLLDAWWDPVLYEQRHMQWEHKEQDALECLYSNGSWVRERTAFLPLRAINSFPTGACYEYAEDPRYFYSEHDRDFVINMAGCEYGRDCWSEMEHFKGVSKKLHSRPWFKFWK